MNDTITTHDIVIANVAGAVLSGTARTWARQASPRGDTSYRRISNHLGSLNPSIMKIVHVPRTGNGVQRSTIGLEQTRTRLDASSNPIGEDKSSVSTQFVIAKGNTEAEILADLYTQCTFVLENAADIAKALYRGEM